MALYLQSFEGHRLNRSRSERHATGFQDPDRHLTSEKGGLGAGAVRGSRRPVSHLLNALACALSFAGRIWTPSGSWFGKDMT